MRRRGGWRELDYHDDPLKHIVTLPHSTIVRKERKDA